MVKVMLVSMPYTILTMPCIGISQLQAVVRQLFQDRVQIDTAHCYIDFAEFVGGRTQYDAIGTYAQKGLADWIFRKAAFDESDGVERYRTFYYADGSFPRKRRMFDLVLSKRHAIEGFLDGLIRRYRLADYQVIGFTSVMSQNVASFAMARRLKQLNPAVVTCLGGANTEHPMGRTIVEQIPDIDYVFSGESLVSFPAFLEALLRGDQEGMRSVKGVHSRGDAGIAFSRPPATIGRIPVTVESAGSHCSSDDLERNSGEHFDLNELPMLDYSEYLDRVDQSPLAESLKAELVLPFQTSTGCWWADKVPCSFCGLTPHSFRQMAAAKARHYISTLIDRYKERFWIFEATDPCMPAEYPSEVFAHVNQTGAALLQYEVKARMPTADVAAMAKANVLLPQPGIESLSTRTLKIMRKGVTAFDNVKFLKDCTEYGLYPIWNYLYGFPNSDYDELDTDKLIQDVRLLAHLPPPASFIPIGFTRYSEYFNESRRYGLRLRPLEWYFHVYPFDSSAVAQIAYFFEDAEYARQAASRNAEMVQAVRLEIVDWMSRFRDRIPKLCFEEDRNVVCDTRSGDRVDHPVSQLETETLEFLEVPRTVEEVATRFNLPITVAGELLGRLQAARFVFSDRAKHMSVVCKQCALTIDAYTRFYVGFLKGTAAAYE